MSNISLRVHSSVRIGILREDVQQDGTLVGTRQADTVPSGILPRDLIAPDHGSSQRGGVVKNGSGEVGGKGDQGGVGVTFP